jgi:tetratricopeptide (TPR) repeat protein
MTDKTKEYKCVAKTEFVQGNYSIAFQTLWGAGVEEFISFGKGKDLTGGWFAHEEAGRHFWNEFILHESVFTALLSADSAEQLLHVYFSKYRIPVPEFERRVASSFPDLFVRAIRVNQVFLDSERIELLSEVPIAEPFRIHQKVWRFLQNSDLSLWKHIEADFESIKTQPIDEVLCHCILWLETSRFQDDSNKHVHHLASVYGFFIEMLLHNQPLADSAALHDESLMGMFLEQVVSIEQKKVSPEDSYIFKLMGHIGNWIRFRDTVLFPYSFDMDIKPVLENEVVMFNSTPEAHYRWLLDGVRYELNRMRYSLKGMKFVDSLEHKEGLIIPGNSEEQIGQNRALASIRSSTMLLLEDIKQDVFQVSRVNQIESYKLLTPLQTYSFNRLQRYETSLTKHFSSTYTWGEAFVKMIRESLPMKVEPFFLMSEKEYGELNAEALSELTDNNTAEVIHLFSFRLNPKKKNPFSRHHLYYDVWKKPFACIGDSLFCPMMFFANNDWFYSFAQVALSQKTDRATTLEMEKLLSEKFAKRRWNARIITNDETNRLNGDVDVFVEDDDTLLYCQLKCSYFRLNLKDAYYEETLVEAKAAKQLNDAQVYLNKPNDIYYSPHKPIKWIVSTSFENLGERADGCYKINYFDLLDALENFKPMSLQEFITILEKDMVMKQFVAKGWDDNIPEAARMMVEEATALLRVFESQSYRQPVFSENERVSQDCHQIFSDALELDGNGRKKEALGAIHGYLNLCPNDGDAYGTLANILADLRDFDASFNAFQKALELLPCDPYITRNYSIALRQSGKWYESLKLILQLYEQFPMLGDVRKICEHDMNKCMELGVLKPEELIAVHDVWDRLR